MANARALDKRRKSIRNIRKITRTMELIATARFKKAMDRATAASAYTDRITKVVADLGRSGLEVSHPLLEQRPEVNRVAILALTSNRGLCGGYNGNVIRMATIQRNELVERQLPVPMAVSGRRGISGFKFRKIAVDKSYTQFDDQPKFQEVEPIAEGYLQEYLAGNIDKLIVVYTKFISSSRQIATADTLLPLTSLSEETTASDASASAATQRQNLYEFLPNAEEILEEVVPMSFKVKLFKCFLDAAVSEQIARMVAMKSATENASDMIKQLSTTYNRARQSQITGEIMEVIGGVEALQS